jgi:small GTP-binding protein
MNTAGEQRIVVLGDAGSGKTSIIEGLSNKTFIPGGNKTTGVNIRAHIIAINNKEVSVNFWDFKGQEITNPVQSLFLSKNCLHLLVLDSASSNFDNRLYHWLESININAGAAPTIIILSKCDIERNDLNRRQIMSEFPFVVDFVITSAMTGQGMEELEKCIGNTVVKLVQPPIPAKWRYLAEYLQRVGKEYISFREFQSLCTKHGIYDREIEEPFLNYFHNNGSIFVSRSLDSNPKVIILNPAWLINRIADLLSSEIILQANGIFEKDWLNKKWPPDFSNIALDIMVNYDICVKLTGKKATYLIPSTLSNVEPAGLYNSLPIETLAYHYVYQFLPSSLFPRLIARLFGQGLVSEYWKTGLLFRDDNNTALITLNEYYRKIEVRVFGPLASRKILLNVIRGCIAQLNTTYDNLKVQELIPILQYPGLTIPFDRLKVLVNDGGVNYITEVFNNSSVVVDIKELWESISFTEQTKTPVKIFISYSSSEKKYLDELMLHLKPLEHSGLISPFHDGNILTGESIIERVETELKQSDIILFLISPSSIASEFINKKEVAFAIESGKAKILPVVLRATDWHSTGLKKFSIFRPSLSQPIAESPNRDRMWALLTEEIRNISIGIQEHFTPVENLIISKVHLENIRAFSNLTLDLSQNGGMFNLLLGENGLGKSTILKSVVIGLSNQSEATSLMAKVQGGLLKAETTSGKIIITLHDIETNSFYELSTIITIDDNGNQLLFKKTPQNFPHHKLFLCGYGASRNGFGSEDVDNYSVHKATATLFDYDARLQNPELALRRIQSKNLAAEPLLRRIEQVLLLETGSVVLDNGGLRISGPWGSFISVGALGDGYSATLGWISDLLGWSLLLNQKMLQTDVSGIVLIDELEQHLHPSWQRIIIKLLKEQFPKVQFIVSSHTPFLAVVAADYKDSGIFGLVRNEDTKEVLCNKISKTTIQGKTIDDVLLTAFDMDSTKSPQTLEAIERFANLKAKPSLSKSEEDELSDLGHLLKIPLPYNLAELKEKVQKYFNHG